MCKLLGKPLAEVQPLPTTEKRAILMNRRKEELRRLIQVYYEERGWNAAGIPTVATLEKLGLWNFLTAATKTKLVSMLS